MIKSIFILIIGIIVMILSTPFALIAFCFRKRENTILLQNSGSRCCRE